MVSIFFIFCYWFICLGSLEIRKTGISFIIGYHTLNQLKERPYVQTSPSQILRRTKTKAVLSHVQDGVPVSQVCENLGIHPNQYYDWQKQAFSSLPHVFSRDAIRQERSHRREVDNLKAKLSQKDEVIAELLTEHIALKKKTGVKN